MPDLNKHGGYPGGAAPGGSGSSGSSGGSSIDPTRYMEIQKELREHQKVPVVKPPMHNPRTTAAIPIPPPELKKARNFIPPRDLPVSHPPEMRIAPTAAHHHLDGTSGGGRSAGPGNPVNNRPPSSAPSVGGDRDPLVERKQEKRKSFEKKYTEIPVRKPGEIAAEGADGTGDIKKRIEVKTVRAKSNHNNNNNNQDRDDVISSHAAKLLEKQARAASEIKAREESNNKLRGASDLAATASLAFEFQGSPEYWRGDEPKKSTPSAPVSVNNNSRDDLASSPELVIEEEEKVETIKAIPDSSRHSPDSSDVVRPPYLSNGNSSVLGYVLEDVSPPSTPNHQPTKRDGPSEGPNKRPRYENNNNNSSTTTPLNNNYHDNNTADMDATSPPHPPTALPDHEPPPPVVGITPGPKFSFSGSIDEVKEDKVFYNGTLGTDERPIQSQHLSSSSADKK
eukprot:sb/3464606/